jgi:hypothetical protein
MIEPFAYTNCKKQEADNTLSCVFLIMENRIARA